MLKICELVRGQGESYLEHGPINIVVCGDSVSHGSVGGGIRMDYNTVYHNRLRLMINEKYRIFPINIINTAVGGKRTNLAVEHFDRDVARHVPDLVIVCFGLNDVNVSKEVFAADLRALFTLCREHGFDVVYMTPNMLNTYSHPETEEKYKEYSEKTAVYQTGGRMDAHMETARAVAKEFDVPVADCYAKWKAMADSGIDTTLLLANRINHPTREMHQMFADTLYETIFGEPYDGKNVIGDDYTAMYEYGNL